MIRLNVYCSVVPSLRKTRLKSSHKISHQPWLIGCRRAHSPLARVSIRAVKGESNGGNSSYPGQSWDPGLEVEVPYEQRPVNEYSSLKDGTLYSWGELGPGPFFIRLGGLWLVTFTTLGVPIAAASFNPSRDPLRFVLAAGTGTLFLVSLIVLRIYLTPKHLCAFINMVIAFCLMYMISLETKIDASPGCKSLGWSYVGDRLLSAVIPYEESGWYDGQMWAKPPEILARDRLIGSYKVKPVIKMLKQTLVGTGAILVTAVLLFIFATPIEEFFQNTFSMKGKITEPVSDISTKYNIRREELLRLPMEVKTDDDLAASAAQAADGRPVYCRNRFYRALAGGQYCKWEDSLK